MPSSLPITLQIRWWSPTSWEIWDPHGKGGQGDIVVAGLPTEQAAVEEAQRLFPHATILVQRWVPTSTPWYSQSKEGR